MSGVEFDDLNALMTLRSRGVDRSVGEDDCAAVHRVSLRAVVQADGTAGEICLFVEFVRMHDDGTVGRCVGVVNDPRPAK